MKKFIGLLSTAVLSLGLLWSCSKTDARLADVEKRLDNIEKTALVNINASIASLESALNTLKNSDIAELKSQCETLSGQIGELKTYAESLSQGVKDWADLKFATIEAMNAIEATLGELQATVAGLPDADDVASAIAAAMKTLNESIAALGARIDALENLIQSVVLVPEYKGGNIVAKSLDGNFNALALKYEVSPASAIDTIIKYKSAVSVDYTEVLDLTKGGSGFGNLEVSGVTRTSGYDDVITVTVSSKALNGIKDLLCAEDMGAAIRLHIAGGSNDVLSEFVDVDAVVSVTPSSSFEVYETDYGPDLYIAVFNNDTGSKFYFDIFYDDDSKVLQEGKTYTLDDMDKDYTFARINNKDFEAVAATYRYVKEADESKTVSVTMDLTDGSTYAMDINIPKYIPHTYDVEAVGYKENYSPYYEDWTVVLTDAEGSAYQFDIYAEELTSGKTFTIDDMDPGYTGYIPASSSTGLPFKKASFTKTVNADGSFSVEAYGMTTNEDEFNIKYEGAAPVIDTIKFVATDLEMGWSSLYGQTLITASNSDGSVEFWIDKDITATEGAFGTDVMDMVYSYILYQGDYYITKTVDLYHTMSPKSITGYFQSTAGTVFELDLSRGAAPSYEKTREATIVAAAEITDKTAAGFFQIVGQSEDKNDVVCLYFLGKSITGTFTEENLYNDPYYTWIKTKDGYFDVLKANLTTTEESGGYLITGKILAIGEDDNTDVPEFDITMVAPGTAVSSCSVSAAQARTFGYMSHTKVLPVAKAKAETVKKTGFVFEKPAKVRFN